MDEKALRVATDQIILRCSAIVGCEMPFTEMFANILSEQIISFIIGFGYNNLTLSEIILAIETNIASSLKMPAGIEVEEITFSGRCVNVTFLSKVLKNYISIRNLLDRKLQNVVDGY